MPSTANHAAGSGHKQLLHLVVDHAANKGQQPDVVQGERLEAPVKVTPCEDNLWDLLGLTVLGALASPWIGLKTLDGITINGGLNLVVSTRNEARVLAGLAHLLEPIKSNQKRRFEAFGEIERKAHLR